MDVKKSVMNSKSVKSFYSQKQVKPKLVQGLNTLSKDLSYKDCYVKLEHVEINTEKVKPYQIQAGKRKCEFSVNEKSKYQACNDEKADGCLVSGKSGENSQHSKELPSSKSCIFANYSGSDEDRIDIFSKSKKNIYYHDNTFWTTSLYKTKKSNDKVKKLDKLNSLKNTKNSLSSDNNQKDEKDKIDLKSSCLSGFNESNSNKDEHLKTASFSDKLTLGDLKRIKEKKLVSDENDKIDVKRLKEDNSDVNVKKNSPLKNIQNKSYDLVKEEILSVEPKLEVLSSNNLSPKKEHPMNREGTCDATTPKQLSIVSSIKDKENSIKSDSEMSSMKNVFKCTQMEKISSSTPLQKNSSILDDKKVTTSVLPITPQKDTDLCSPDKSRNKELSEDPLFDDEKMHDSSFDLSFTSTVNTSIEDGDDVDQEKRKKKLRKESIMDYFKVVESKKIKSIDRMKDAELIVIEKKKDKPSKSELNALFTLPISPRLQLQSSKAPKKNIAKRMKKKSNSKYEQTYIDIGQKNFGHVKCQVCGMVYTKNQEDDEAQHLKFHQKVIEKLDIKRGWKNERIIQEFPDGRIIMISSDDHPSHLKKLAEVREIVDTELGFAAAQKHSSEQQAFLFLIARKIVGCAIAVSIDKAYPVIPNAEFQPTGDSPASWCCSTESVSALCGISRVWVLSNNRRQKIASRLVDCIRYHFLYGCVIPKTKVAFSDPTPNGRSFAEKYVGTKEILVFR